jgi:hypothetical protein
LVYCASTGWSQVAVIAGNGSRMLDVLQVGAGPFCFAAAPRHHRLYVACNKVYVIRDKVTAIAETPEPERAEAMPGPTIVRDVLRLGQSGDRPSSGGTVPVLLLDPAGRIVMHLLPGDNDVRHLSPGVYFVSSPHRSPLPQGARVQKVVLAR